MLFELGMGVPKDGAKSMEWLQRAAENGEPAAQYWLAMHYQRGGVFPANFAEAVKWYGRSAEQGYMPAKHNLAIIGETAALQISAEEGNSDAQCEIGWTFMDGRRIGRDYLKAVEWFERSAMQGNVSAQLILGNLYNVGNRVEKDNIEAHKWFRLAAERGSREAITALHDFYEKLALEAKVRGNLSAISDIRDMFTLSDFYPLKYDDCVEMVDEGNLGAQCLLGLCLNSEYRFRKISSKLINGII
jgi:TPR repeat protein